MRFHVYKDSPESEFSSINKESRFSDYSKTFKNSIDKLKNKKIENFHVYEEVNGSTFELDKVNSISKVCWIGNVDLETASNLLTLVDDSIEHQGFTKLVIDHHQLEYFETDARIWIKNFLETGVKRLAKKVDRMAIINAKSSRGSIFGNIFTTTINSIMPGLKVNKFDTPEGGIEWLLE